MPLDFKATNLPKNKRRQKKSQRGIKPRFGIRKNSKWVNLIFSNLILNSVDDNVHSVSKSLYMSHVVSNFYGTEIEICAGFGPVGSTEKTI